MSEKANAAKRAQQNEVRPTNSGRRFSKPSCLKMSIGNRSRRSHLASSWLSSWVSPRNRALTQLGSKRPMARS